jgi:hypothetical protein
MGQPMPSITIGFVVEYTEQNILKQFRSHFFTEKIKMLLAEAFFIFQIILLFSAVNTKYSQLI